MIQIWAAGVCWRSADISEWLPHRSWCSTFPLVWLPITTPLVKIAATAATAPAAIATDAAIRFRRFSGQRHLTRDRAVRGAVPVTTSVGEFDGSETGSPVAVDVGSVVGSLVAVGSAVSSEFGSGLGSAGCPGVSVIPSTLATDGMRRICPTEEDAVDDAGASVYRAERFSPSHQPRTAYLIAHHPRRTLAYPQPFLSWVPDTRSGRKEPRWLQAWLESFSCCSNWC